MDSPTPAIVDRDGTIDFVAPGQKAGNPESQNRDGRELTSAERFALADTRQMEAKWNGLVDRVKAIANVDQRQVAIAVTEAEGAFMRLARAIARPERAVEDQPSFANLAREIALDDELQDICA